MQERKSTLDFLRKKKDRLKSLNQRKNDVKIRTELDLSSLEKHEDINLPEKIEGELHLPNLEESPKSFLDTNRKLEKIEGKLELPSLEEIENAYAVMESVGVDSQNFFFGNPSEEEIKKAMEAISAVGMDPIIFLGNRTNISKKIMEREKMGLKTDKKEIKIPEKIEGEVHLPDLHSLDDEEKGKSR